MGVSPLIDVPAWLLLNSMRMESLQFIQLSTQELQNVWRKHAIGKLLDEAHASSSQRLVRTKLASPLVPCPPSAIPGCSEGRSHSA